MTTMLIAQDETRQSGSFMGDQLCSLKTAYCFLQAQPDVDHVVMSVSAHNEMDFLWTKFVADPRGDGSLPPVELVVEDWEAGDWTARWNNWDRWRTERRITMNDGHVREFDHYRELYLRIHGAQRQNALCGVERGIGRKNIYEYWLAGQENTPCEFPGADWFGDGLVHHPALVPERDVYISPHAKTQGNLVFSFDFWTDVVHHLVDSGVTVTVGWDQLWFCQDLGGHPLFKRHWGDHRQWMEEICRHKLVACGNTGTGWLAAACGVPMVTMEPHNSVMADHRFRECGLQNIVEVVDGPKLDEMGNNMTRVAEYVANRIRDIVHRRIVMTTGCYDILHAGHVRHLQRARAMGTKLIVALNSDDSVRRLKGHLVPDRPIHTAAQRRAVLEELRCVDEVRVFEGDNALDLIREVRPDVLAVGFGYKPETIVGRELVESWGGKAVVTCTGDASNEPSTTRAARRMRSIDVSALVQTAMHYSVNPPEKLRFMAEQFLSVAHLDGDVADLGACRGGTALILSKLCEKKYLHVFDTWEGTPYDDPMCHHKRGEWAVSLEDCRKLVGEGWVHYHKGTFPFTLEWSNEPVTGLETFCFVYVDMDTHQATKDAIEFFWPRLVPGGKMVFDDYGWEPCAGVKVAVDAAFSEDQRSVMKPIHSCVVRK